MRINGYQIIRNDFWGSWQVWHPCIGFVGEYINIIDALNDCNRG